MRTPSAKATSGSSTATATTSPVATPIHAACSAPSTSADDAPRAPSGARRSAHTGLMSTRRLSRAGSIGGVAVSLFLATVALAAEHPGNVFVAGEDVRV